MDTLDVRMARMESDLRSMTSHNRRIKALLVAVLAVACLPYVRGGGAADVVPKLVKAEQFQVVQNGKVMATLGSATVTAPTGPSKGGTLELLNESGKPYASMAANDRDGGRLVLSSYFQGPAIELSGHPRGSATLKFFNQDKQLAASLGTDMNGSGALGINDKNGKVAAALSANAVPPPSGPHPPVQRGTEPFKGGLVLSSTPGNTVAFKAP